MKTTIKYFYDENEIEEPFVIGATLDCNVSEILLISAALHDLKNNKERNDIDKAYAIKMIENIVRAMDNE